jgi:ubiquinone/menaquinone biosynthesis C-methylase UbiE
MTAPPSGLTKAQRLDAAYFHGLWQELYTSGKIACLVPPDEQMWQEDLGRSLEVAFAWLGDLQGQQILELGCGPGDYTIMLARRGAQVTAIDIAPSSLWITNERAEANQVDHAIQTSLLAAESLAFTAETFDWVIGFGLLHHADPVTLGPEIRRVLRPHGRALFREPLGTNPLLQFTREWIPYRAKRRSLNENPLKYQDINGIGRHFQTTRLREFYLFSMISRAIGHEMSFPTLWHMDEYLLKRLAFARRWCRYVLVEYTV